jgi:hypothetical protein
LLKSRGCKKGKAEVGLSIAAKERKKWVNAYPALKQKME